MKTIFVFFMLCAGIATAAVPSMSSRMAYLDHVEATLDKWDDRADNLKDTAGRDTFQRLNDLELDSRDLRGEVSRAREMSGDNWDDERALIEKAFASISVRTQALLNLAE